MAQNLEMCFAILNDNKLCYWTEQTLSNLKFKNVRHLEKQTAKGTNASTQYNINAITDLKEQ